MPYNKKYCIICKQEFIPNSSTQKYCINCKTIAYKEYRKTYKQINKDRIKKYNIENSDRDKLTRKKYRESHKLERKLYLQNNKKSINNTANIYIQKRKIKDPSFMLIRRERTRINKILKRKCITKNKSVENYIGCSTEQLREYLEKQFKPWMTWNNRGLYNGEFEYGWDIDHIIPLSSVKTEEELIKLFHYTNLQSLDSKINRYIKKNNI